MADGVCRNSNPTDCIDANPLGEEDVGVCILNSLHPLEVPPGWRFSLRQWSLCNVLHDGVSLWNHSRHFDQMQSALFAIMRPRIGRPSTKDQNVLRTYLRWDAKKCFKWIMDSAYEPIWINMNTIFCAWKPRKGSKSETIIIPQKHIDFAKDNLARIAVAKNDVENENEDEDEDGE